MANVVEVIRNELRKELYYEENLLLINDISYPQFFSSDFQPVLDEINKFYELRAKGLQKYSELELYKSAIEQYNLSIMNDYPVREYISLLDFMVTYNKKCTISVFNDKYEYTGGAHGDTSRVAETWNLNTGAKYHLEDFFDEEFDYRSYVLDIIYQEIEKRDRTTMDQYFSDYRRLARNYLGVDNFYLTEEGIVIFFQQYEVAPYSTGIVEILVPFSEEGAQARECLL